MLHKEKGVILEVKISTSFVPFVNECVVERALFEWYNYYKQVLYLIAHLPRLQSDRGVQGEYGDATSILRLLEVTEDGLIPEHIAKVI